MTVCEWPVSYAECGGAQSGTSAVPCEAFSGMSDNEKKNFEQMAIDLLYQWTGQKFGLCSVSVRPCKTDCGSFVPAGSTGAANEGWRPVVIGGNWYNITCGECGPAHCDCGIRSGASLALPGPVDSIQEIFIDGSLFPDTSYALVGSSRALVRTDGGLWPTCQNLTLPTTRKDTFLINYKRGIPVPIGGQRAAGTLACELAKAACSDPTCDLPERVQTITRQGVTIGFTDSFDGLDKGRTGLWSVDAWIASVTMSTTMRAYASVISPDTKSGGGRTW